MLGVVKLLYSLSNSLPMLREILIDIVSFIKDANAANKYKKKCSVIDSRIDSILNRMHHDKNKK